MENRIHNLLLVAGKERGEGTKVKEYNDELVNNFKQIFQLEEGGK